MVLVSDRSAADPHRIMHKEASNSRHRRSAELTLPTRTVDAGTSADCRQRSGAEWMPGASEFRNGHGESEDARVMPCLLDQRRRPLLDSMIE
jgi:hypothetical protein